MATDRMSRFVSFVGRVIPDALTSCIAMMVALALAAWLLGNAPVAIADAYYRGLWMLLPFTMQMTLILVLSASLASAPAFRRLALRLAQLPRSEAQLYATVILATGSLSYLYWALGLAMGPLLAIYCAREAEKRGIRADFPCLLASAVAAQCLWQFGLSSSAALLMNTPGHFLEAKTGLLPLATTIWSPAALALELTFLLALLLAWRFLRPATPQPVSQFADTLKVIEEESPSLAVTEPAVALSLSQRLERSSLPLLILAAALGGWLVYHFAVKKLSVDLNVMNTTLLLVALLIHRNSAAFSRALQTAVLTCWSVVVLYHLYAGVAGLIQYTTLGTQLAAWFAAISTPLTFTLLTALGATLVAVFVPSSGGQWVIQGFVTTEAAAAVGVSTQKGLLAVSVGDQMGNLVSPFWAVVTSGIARIDFRRFIGYMIAYSVIWFAIGVLAVTFLPS
jgi:short-chain fatty acids transporter